MKYILPKEGKTILHPSTYKIIDPIGEYVDETEDPIYWIRLYRDEDIDIFDEKPTWPNYNQKDERTFDDIKAEIKSKMGK